jgi:hypothetical protein
MPRHPTAPVNVARISVATSEIDFTAPDADSQRSSWLAYVLGDHMGNVGTAGIGTASGPLLDANSSPYRLAPLRNHKDAKTFFQKLLTVLLTRMERP